MADERIAQLVRQGQQAAQQGNNELARSYLQAAVDLEPDNVTAWLWLAGVVDGPEEARHALNRVLALDPANQHARDGLEQLEARLGAAGVAPAAAPAAAATPSVQELVASEGHPLDRGPLTIEQELRAALRAHEPAQPSDAGAVMAAESVDRGQIFATRSNDVIFRIMSLVLAMFLVVGFVFFAMVVVGVI